MTLKGLSQSSPRAVLAGVFILSALPFLTVELFHARLYRVMDVASYLVFHNVAEFFSIMVSLSIFGVGWFTFEQSEDRHALFLSFAFLGIGLMDFMHTLSYAGMPDFITPNSANKSTQFWIAVRLFTASAFLISAFVYPDRPLRWLSKQNLTAAALIVSGLVFAGIVFYPSQMPATFIEGVGLTPFKKISEYLIICLLFLASIAYWNRFSKTSDRLLIYYIAAFIICIFSELVFAVYKSVFDTFNVLGHIYKVVAFSLIYKGIFTASVKSPYVELKKAEEEWERTFDAIIDPIMILDTDHRIVKANKAMAEKLGVSSSAAEGLTCYTSVHGTNEPPPFCPHSELLADGKPHSVEILEPRLGGYFLVSVSPLYAPEGKLYGSIHYARDITERKRADDALKESEERFRSIFDSAGDGILLADAEEKKFSLCNRWICEMLGYAPEEIKNLGVRDIHPEEHLPHTLDEFERQSRGEITLAKDIPVKRKDGSVFYADIRSTPIMLDGKRYIMGIFRDVTERKQTEVELRKRLDELERFMKETVKREFRVKDLKDKVASLEEELRKKT